MTPLRLRNSSPNSTCFFRSNKENFGEAVKNAFSIEMQHFSTRPSTGPSSTSKRILVRWMNGSVYSWGDAPRGIGVLRAKNETFISTLPDPGIHHYFHRILHREMGETTLWGHILGFAFSSSCVRELMMLIASYSCEWKDPDKMCPRISKEQFYWWWLARYFSGSNIPSIIMRPESNERGNIWDCADF